MISTKKIIEMARKWQKQATNRKKRISWRRTKAVCSKSAKAEKGHFVVYSTDKMRFVLPLVYLKNEIFRELFKLAGEEFGLSSNVPLTLPCDGTVIEYVIMLIRRNVDKHLEDAVLMSIAAGCCQSSFHLHQQSTNQHFLVCGF